MYALEEEPEKQGRWRRLGGGALLAVVLACGMSYAATKYEPARRMLQKVVKLTVNVESKEPPPPPPENPLPPPPPPERARPKQKAMAPQPKQAPSKPSSDEPRQVGLDSESFAEGGGGPTFGAGETLMGSPSKEFQPPVKKAPPAPPPTPVFREARPRGTIPAVYTDRARRLGVQGLMVLEVDVDPNGRVTNVRLRRGLERSLDEEAVRALRKMSFEPATRGGAPVASTRFVRIRYALRG